MYYVYSRATTFRTVVGLLYGSTFVRKYFQKYGSTKVLSKVVVLSYEIENTFVLSKVYVYCRDPGAGGPAGGAGIEGRV
jgi:hypothetical protein